MLKHETIEKVVARSKKAWDEKELWRATFRDAYIYAIPGRNLYLENSPGQLKNETLFDSTLVSAVQRSVNKYVSELFPPGEQFLNIVTGKLWGAVAGGEAERRKVQAMLDDLTSACFGAIYSSNFDLSIPEVIYDFLISMGFMLVNPGNEYRMFECCAVPLYQVAHERGAYGATSAIFRTFNVKARDVEPTWTKLGFKEPAGFSKLVDDKPAENIECLEATYMDYKSGKWMYEVLIKGKWDGKDNGYARVVENERDYCPWVVISYSTLAGESYGRGPVLMALPDARVLNKIKELSLQNASLAIAPPLMIMDDGVINFSTIKMKPGAPIHVARNDGSLGPTIKPLILGENFDVANLVIGDLQQTIRRIMMDDELPAEQGAVRSATEYMARARQGQRNSAPRARIMDGMRQFMQLVVHALEEKEVVSAIMQKHGIPPSKIRVDGLFADIEITSPMFQTQKLDKLDAMTAYLQMSAGIGGIAMGPAGMAMKVEELDPWLWENLGLPSKFIRSPEEREEMQVNAAKVQAAQMQPQGATA